MAERGILSEYSSDSRQPDAGRADNGGQCVPKPIPYSPPRGPIGQMHEGPGLGGTNHGNAGTQHK